MSAPRLSAETIHASTVARDGRAVLITGASGSGKSDLALRLIDAGFSLISDDQTIVKREGTGLIAASPATIAGKLEVRGIGILQVEHVEDVPIALVVELRNDIERFPDDSRSRLLLGIPVPMVSIDALTSSAVAKVKIALRLLGTP